MTGMVFEIKKFAVHDGDGIRTTVFLKGCSLNCAWCHNPEGISFEPQLSYVKKKCINCGRCTNVMGCNAHKIENGLHLYDRNLCIACGRCEEHCFTGALHLYGKEMSTDEVLEIILEDREFYESTGGGVTLSGGECLCQPDFCAELLKKCKENGVSTAVDTAGNVPLENIIKVMPYTDIFLYDLKPMDSDMHKKGTMCANNKILENLNYISENGGNIEIRIPVIPGYNEECIEQMGLFLKTLSKTPCVKFLEYHNMAESKYKAIGINKKMIKPVKGSTAFFEKMFREMGITVK